MSASYATPGSARHDFPLVLDVACRKYDSAAREAGRALDEIDRLRAENERLRVAVLDIDAHATPLGEDDDGFVSVGYAISVGCLHRALGIVGHSAPKGIAGVRSVTL